MVHYDAFISYRHTPRDTAVAKEIQQELERFRLPEAIRKSTGIQKIERIFRDQEELEITSDLSGKISDALNASDYLIVICSPAYKESKWCLQELETFIRDKGTDKVFCVLSEGEPPEIFPEILRHRERTITDESGQTTVIREEVEPLACDYRGNFKEARKTELPRLVSGIVGCRYDDLILRQEKYRQRRMFTIFAGIFLLSAVAVSYLLWSNSQIQKNYTRALIRESQILASEAMTKYEEKDRLEALSAAIKAFPSEDNERPLTDEAEFALTRASAAYVLPYPVLESWKIDEDNDITEYFVSADHQYIVYLDHGGMIHAADMSAHEEVCSFRLSENSLPKDIAEGKPGELICYVDGAVVSAEYLTGTVCWEMPLKYQSLGSSVLSPDKEYIAGGDTFAVQIMTREGIPYLSLPLPEDYAGYILDLCWSDDGEYIAVRLRNPDTTYSIGRYSLETSEFQIISDKYTKIRSYGFDHQNHLYLFTDNNAVSSDSYMDSTHLYQNSYQFLMYDNTELQYQKDFVTTAQIPFVYVKDTGNYLSLAFGRSIYLFDREGNLLRYGETEHSIESVLQAGQISSELVTTDGSRGYFSYLDGSIILQKNFPEACDNVTVVLHEDPRRHTYIAANQGNLAVYEPVYDPNGSAFRGKGLQEEPVGHVISGNHLVLLADDHLYFSRLDTQETEKSVALEKGHAYSLLAADDTYVRLLMINAETGKLSIHTYTLESAEKTGELELPLEEQYITDGILTYPLSESDAILLDAKYAYNTLLTRRNGALLFHDMSNPNRIVKVTPETGDIQEFFIPDTSGYLVTGGSYKEPSRIVASEDGRYLWSVMTEYDQGIAGREKMVLYDTVQDTCTELSGKPAYEKTAVFGPDKLYTAGERGIYVYNLSGVMQYAIPYTGDTVRTMCVHDSSLSCVFPDGVMKIYEGDTLKRTVNLSVDTNSYMSDSLFRFVFTDKKLYFFSEDSYDMIRLDSDSDTPAYTVGDGALAILPENHLLFTGYDYRKGDTLRYPVVFREYTPEELLRYAESQLNTK
ncbi:MAG: toll/interleukin-1 receptor domain-containing protein [Solobacterium sp.]|nr:toll/interleukin-1 receptor domain-containing protein [Solobacterium sp.]